MDLNQGLAPEETGSPFRVRGIVMSKSITLQCEQTDSMADAGLPIFILQMFDLKKEERLNTPPSNTGGFSRSQATRERVAFTAEARLPWEAQSLFRC